MPKIDAHQHFWKFDPVRDSWITTEMAVIQTDFLPADLQPVLEKAGFDGCVAVQASQSEEETNFLVSLAARHSFIKGVVGWVDLQAGDIDERLRRFRAFPVVKGFRHVLQGEPRRDLMLDEAFQRGIGALQRHGYTYDLLIFTDQMKFSAELVAAFPEQKFVIDHLAKPGIREQEIAAWQQNLALLASYPNVYCKISGMVTEADWKAWKKSDFTPYLDAAVEAFGTNRILFGSDWPVCLVAASYEEMLGIVTDYFSGFSTEEQDAFFGGNAARFYNL